MSAIVVFFLIIGGIVYFVPTLAARGGDRVAPVFVINLFFGWTLLGWVIALAIAASSKEVRPTKDCIRCAESVLEEASICKHCGFIFSGPAVEPDILPSVEEIAAYGQPVKPRHRWRAAGLAIVVLTGGWLAYHAWQQAQPQPQPEVASQAVQDAHQDAPSRELVIVPEPDPAALGIILDRQARADAPLTPLVP